MKGAEILEIKDLSVEFQVEKGVVEVVDRVSLSLKGGQTLALVGESGCGKSVTASSVMRLLPHPQGRISSGEILFQGEDLLKKPVEEMYTLRGGKISMVFQEPMTAMNPVHTGGKQLREVFELHRPDLKGQALEREILSLLKRVEMPSPEERVKNYPFQLSGGMRQRMMIAMALAAKPDLLIADEPTTALDVTVQAQILRLIRSLQKENDMAVLFITHDMGVVAQMSDHVAVMYAGQIVETGDVHTIFLKSAHPYTQGLIGSMPHLETIPQSPLPSIEGNVPSPQAYPATCRFAGRCNYAEGDCHSHSPSLERFGPDHFVRCFKAGRLHG